MRHQARLFYRPFMESPEPCSVPWIYRRTRHPVFAWLGLRPIFAQHTSAEHETLKRWACGRRRLVEIGVAEGDRKSTRLNSSHVSISYAVFCLKKKMHCTTCTTSADETDYSSNSYIPC